MRGLWGADNEAPHMNFSEWHSPNVSSKLSQTVLTRRF
jgi:hypothetical protein